ncbi:MAG: cytidine deaminase [Firmicutes bacterium]|nr:cytidine deaminase [Bacillota bacterium]
MAMKRMVFSKTRINLARSFYLLGEEALKIQKKMGISAADLLRKLASEVSQQGIAPISHYQVGAAVLGKSGNIYLGVNLEFPGVPLNQTIHAEQFAVINAFNHGERGITFLAVTAPPCGCCRQWVSEIGDDSSKLKVLISRERVIPFIRLLPHSFESFIQGTRKGFLSPQNNGLKSADKFSPLRGFDKELWSAALRAVNASYAPYSKAFSGIALRAENGKIYMGSYIENAAFNPSLSPLQTALIALVSDGQSLGKIKKVLLLERKGALISQESQIRDSLKKIVSHATFTPLFF